MKLGDKIAYIKYDVSSWSSSRCIGTGDVFFIEDNKIGCCKYDAPPVYVNLESDTERCMPVNEDTKTAMLLIIDNEIVKLRNCIKTLTSEEKDEMIKSEFQKIKLQIIATGKSMVAKQDDSEFINCLKEICRLKPKLFSIKISELNNVHKKNGAVKMKIKSLTELRQKIENEIFE